MGFVVLRESLGRAWRGLSKQPRWIANLSDALVVSTHTGEKTLRFELLSPWELDFVISLFVRSFQIQDFGI